MSHFTYIKTRFQKLFYLEKALTKLNISYREQEKNTANFKQNMDKKYLVIAQTNNHDLEFNWNGHEYELVVDMSFWDQPYPVESFIDKVAQQYASEIIIGESQQIGFQPIKFQQNVDGSNTLILERWNNKKSLK